MATVPLKFRYATIHYVDGKGLGIARQNVTLGWLERQCFRGRICPMGLEPGQTCQVSPRCTDATPEAWARYLRLDELDRLGRDVHAED